MLGEQGKYDEVNFTFIELYFTAVQQRRLPDFTTCR